MAGDRDSSAGLMAGGLAGLLACVKGRPFGLRIGLRTAHVNWSGLVWNIYTGIVICPLKVFLDTASLNRLPRSFLLPKMRW